MKTMTHPLAPEFEFASFTFPKYVFTLPKGSRSKRLERAKNNICGPYYHSPKPNHCKGASFYLESDFMPGLRWKWADAVISIDHRGWYSDEFGDSEKIRGIVMRLPKGRGFLAGWSMGEGMASEIGSDIYDTIEEAARGADSEAESVAEREREYQEEQRQEEEQTIKRETEIAECYP